MATRIEKLRIGMEKEAARARAKLRGPAIEYGKAWAALRALDGHAATPAEVHDAICEAANTDPVIVVDVEAPKEATPS